VDIEAGDYSAVMPQGRQAEAVLGDIPRLPRNLQFGIEFTKAQVCRGDIRDESSDDAAPGFFCPQILGAGGFRQSPERNEPCMRAALRASTTR